MGHLEFRRTDLEIIEIAVSIGHEPARGSVHARGGGDRYGLP